MQPNALLPSFNYHGYLPEGIHEASLDAVRVRFVFNPQRVALWERVDEFVRRVIGSGAFSHVYLDGGFITAKAAPEDVDLILQPTAPYGAAAFAAMEPFFAEGIDAIYDKYSVHLHFWCEGFPGGMSDFRRFFQYMRPHEAARLGLREGVRKGIIRVKL